MALSANRQIAHREPARIVSFPIEDAKKIYKGAQCIVNADGFLEPASALANNLGFTVIAAHEQDLATANGSHSVECFVDGMHLLQAASGLAQTDVGTVVHSTADDAIGASATNLAKAGTVLEFISATEEWVDIGTSLASPDVGT